MSPGSEVLKVLAVDSYPGTCHSDLAVEHDRVCWGSENIERHTLFTWRPGMAAPRALYSNTNPHDIGDISVSGDLVLVATLQPDDYDSLSPVDGGPTWDPHEWRLVSLQTPGVAKRLPTSPTGARAVLGDGFVTWTEPEHDKLLRYVLIDTVGNIGPVRLVPIPHRTDFPRADEVSGIQAKGKRLVWSLSNADGEHSCLATWKIGALRSRVIPNSQLPETYAFTSEYVAWIANGVHIWRIGAKNSSVLSRDTRETTWIDASGDRIVWSARKNDHMRLLTMNTDDTRPHTVWEVAPKNFDEGDDIPVAMGDSVAICVSLNEEDELSRVLIATPRRDVK